MHFTDPEATEKPDDTEKDKPDEEPAPQKSQTRSLYRLRYTSQMTKIDESAIGGADEEDKEDEEDEDEEEGEEEDDEDWDVIQEQVDSRKIRVKVQAGNHNQWVMKLQLKLYQAGRNFKPIFVADITPNSITATHARRKIGTVVYQEEEDDEEEKEDRGNKFKWVTLLTLECMHTKQVTDQNVLYFRKET